MDDEYDLTSKAPLKFKREVGHSSKDASATIAPTSTKAEQSFKKMHEKRAKQRILEKASKTHKQRVEEFNKHLDSLTEHYDIPKVSWTK